MTGFGCVLHLYSIWAAKCYRHQWRCKVDAYISAPISGMCCFQEQLPLIRNETWSGVTPPFWRWQWRERERPGLFGSGFVFPLWCPGSGIVTMFWRLYQSSPRLLSNMVGLRRTLKIGASELNYQSVARWNFETASAQSQTYTGNHLKLPEENCLQWLEGKLDVPERCLPPTAEGWQDVASTRYCPCTVILLVWKGNRR